MGTGEIIWQTVHDHLVSKRECLLLWDHHARSDILKCSLFSRRGEFLRHSDPRRCGWVCSWLLLSLPSTWTRYQRQGWLLRGWLAFNDCLQMPQLHLIQLLSLNRNRLIVDQLVKLPVLLKNHLRLASLIKVPRRILGLPCTTSWSSSRNNRFFSIVNFGITLSRIEVSTDLQLICLRYYRRIGFLSIDSLLSLIHGGISPLSYTCFVCPVNVNSRLLLLVWRRDRRGSRSSALSLLNSFVQSLLLLV